MLRVVVSASLVLSAFSYARADAATPADWRLFLERSYGDYWSATDPVDFEDLLYAAAKLNRSQEAAIAAFAGRLGVPTDVARAHADFIVDAVKLRVVCEDSTTRECDFAPGARFYERVAREGMAEPTGALMIVAAKNLRDSSSSNGRITPNEASLVRLAVHHPAAATVFRALFQYRRGPHYLAALLGARPLTDETALVLSYAVTHAGNPDEWDGWLEALIEDAERDAAQAPPAQRAALAQLALMRKLKLGLTREAVASYLAYPVEIRALLPLRPKACAEADGACELVREAAFELADELTAALWLQGQRQHAVALLQGWRDSAGPRSFNAAQRHEALSEAIAPGLSKEALFTLFVEGRRPNEPPLDIERIPADRAASSPGWLFSVHFTGAALSEIVAARLRLAGYESMADFLVGHVLYGRPDGGGPGLGRDFSFLLPERLAARQAYWASRIEAVWTQREAQRLKTRTPSGMPPRTPWWTEQALPRHVRAWRQANRPEPPPKNVPLPVAPERVLRHEMRNGEHFIVYRSSEVERPGPFPAEGFWFAQTEGGVWRPSLYLGLQQHFPYVVTPASALALVDGAKLRIEVRVREIDPEAGSNPPRYKRSADGLFIEFDLGVLAADRDADGLTDIVERRLGLKFDDPDTDKDGLADGTDPLPLTPFDPNAPEPVASAALAILLYTIMYDAGVVVNDRPVSGTDDLIAMIPPAEPRERSVLAISSGVRTEFLVADPRIFAGVRTPFRLILYSREDLAALDRYGPFHPPEVTHLFASPDGKGYYFITVELGERWSGQELFLRCGLPSGGCERGPANGWSIDPP